MADDVGTVTVAETYVRKLLRGETPRALELGLLALERALVRDRAEFLMDAPNGDGFVGRTASHRVSPDGEAEPLDEEVLAGCRHVADWLVTSLLENAAWLDRTDASGRPLKLLKIGSLARAVHVADKDMRRRLAEAGRIVRSGPDGVDEIVHVELDDGWSLVRLLTPEALDAESSVMQHCIGQGAYDAALADGRTTFLSLRDPRGEAHATLELKASPDGPPSVAQLQGKQNRRPEERYLRRIRPWLRENALCRSDFGGYAWWSRLVEDADGRVLAMEALPDRVSLRSFVEIVLMEGDLLPRELLRSPFDLAITIDPTRTSPVVLPDRIACGTTVALNGPGTFLFGSSFDATSLKARGCTLRSMPRGFEARRSTILKDCDVDLLPSGSTYGRLLLPGTSARFEEGFSGVVVDLAKSKVETLPRGFDVDILFVKDCPLREIPDGSRIGSLKIVGSELRRLGSVLGLRGLELIDTSPDLVLPEVLEIDGPEVGPGLVVQGPGVPSTLPRRLAVRGVLQVDGSPGLALPEDLDVDVLKFVGRTAPAVPDGARIRSRILMLGPDSLEFGTSCEIGEISIHRFKSKDSEFMEHAATIAFDPSIVRVDRDGTIARRDPSPSP